MTQRVHGSAFAYESASRELEAFTVYTKSPNAFSDPDNAEGVNIEITKNYRDITQKNFEIILQGIGLRAMPVLMDDPIAVKSLEKEGAPSLSGEGFVWNFAVETKSSFAKTIDNEGTMNQVALLTEELDGLILANVEILRTQGKDKNIEFVYDGEDDYET